MIAISRDFLTERLEGKLDKDCWKTLERFGEEDAETPTEIIMNFEPIPELH